ncbi:MAG: hypothetical protein IPK16_23480 [Anaerolineales bacterium]|nr:hypothetical protein [Anaerolineales bacterium]
MDAIRAQVDALETNVASMTAEDRAAIAGRIKDTVQSQLGPTIKTLRITLSAVTTSLVALNRSLESANRLPGVSVPTFTDQLQTADQKLGAISESLDSLVTAAADVSVDGSKLESTLALTSDQLADVQTTLSQMTEQLTTGSAQIGAVGNAAPGVIDLTSVVISLLAVLMGAGQLSLIFKGVAMFRQDTA